VVGESKGEKRLLRKRGEANIHMTAIQFRTFTSMMSFFALTSGILDISWQDVP